VVTVNRSGPTTCPCPICKKDGHAFGVRSGFALGQCNSCGHTFTLETPSTAQIDAVYERYSYEEQHLDALPTFLEGVVREKVRSFSPYRSTGRILDVGFGAGALLRAAKNEGWRPYGIEVSALAVDQAKERGFEDVLLGDFTSAPFESNFFDVIVMSELIEHLPEPSSFILRAHDLLVPGGLLYLTTPHGRGISGRVLREGWSVCSPPEHLHLFSRTSMRHCLERSGFHDLRIEARNVHPHELIAWAKRPVEALRRQSGTAKSKPMESALSPDTRVQGSYRVNAALLGSPWGRLLKKTANRVLDLTSLGDGLVVYATAGRK